MYNKKQCLIIMQFGRTEDDRRKQSDLVDDLFRPAILKAFPVLQDNDIKRADEIAEEEGSILNGLINALATFEYVFADISHLNANVFYELGIRHALRPRTTFVVRNRETNTPFDIYDITNKTYVLNFLNSSQYKRQLPEQVNMLSAFMSKRNEEYVERIHKELQGIYRFFISAEEGSRLFEENKRLLEENNKLYASLMELQKENKKLINARAEEPHMYTFEELCEILDKETVIAENGEGLTYVDVFAKNYNQISVGFLVKDMDKELYGTLPMFDGLGLLNRTTAADPAMKRLQPTNLGREFYIQLKRIGRV